jgi:hypothetical protein
MRAARCWARAPVYRVRSQADGVIVREPGGLIRKCGLIWAESGRNAWCVPLCRPNSYLTGRSNLVRINFEADECVRTERAVDGGIGSIATARDQYPPDARNIIAGIEGMPSAA